MLLKIVVFICCASTASSESIFSRHKRDTRSVINEALNLYYYGQNFKMPTLTMNTKATSSCAASGLGNAYYLNDIIGQAENIGSVQDCMAGCMNIKECVAVNYVADLKQCVALKSGTNDGKQLFVDKELAQSKHFLFKDCPSKPNKPATKPDGGSAPSGCGLPFFQQNLLAGAKTRIIGGSEAVPYSYPWIGRLTYDLGNNMLSMCGSSLVMSGSSTESDLVITAAHCVVNDDDSERDVNKFTVYFGNHDNRLMESQEQQVAVKKVIRNKGYSKAATKSDIAMLKLKTPVKFNNYIRPVCIPNAGQEPKDGKSCIVAGWGRISDSNQDTAKKLLQLRTPIIDDKTCASKWGGTFENTSMICAGNQDGATSTCQGDSGGPLTCFEDGHWTLYGAVSFGGKNKCADKDLPSVFARVSALRPWIDTTMAELKKA